MLSGINDPSMKYAFIMSLLKEISLETFRLIKIKDQPVASTPLGVIFHHVLKVVEKLCTQHQYFKNLTKGIVNIK